MENKQPIGADCVCDLGSEKHYHPQCEYLMENKDWREEFGNWFSTNNIALKADIVGYVADWWLNKITQAVAEESVRVRGIIEGMKFPEIKGGSKEMPHSEFPTAKPAHESNEVLMQYAHNQALNTLLSSLDKPDIELSV